MEILKANLSRGKKWTEVRRKYEFEQRTKDIEWLDSQKSIVQDIKAYKDYLNPVEVKEIKSKGKK